MVTVFGWGIVVGWVGCMGLWVTGNSGLVVGCGVLGNCVIVGLNCF